MASLSERHIQNFSEAKGTEPHWGYVDRAVPCTNDAGSCSYLDVVYHSHDLGMIYAGVLWATTAGILLVWGVGRLLALCKRGRISSLQAADNGTDVIESSAPSPRHGSLSESCQRAIASLRRQYLLPEVATSIFGHTTRLQVLVFAMICGYLTVWTFVGIIYNTWVTPVKNTPGVYNTRTSLGPWADRIGVLAYALTPLSVLLSSRESLLSIITGLPYQSFMFLHRWLGYVIIIQSSLHTIGWCIVEWRLYQPQPTVWNGVISQLYIIWGVVAMVLLLIMYLLSMPWAIQVTGYEFFKKSHYVLAMVYIGAVIGHWSRLECFLIPGLVLWFLDRLARVIRTGFLHFKRYPNEMVAFKPATATISLFPDQDNGDVVRLDFQHVRGPWKIGQHFYLCFCESSIWQSHPMTPVSLPVPEDDGRLRHAYVIRVRKGETRRIALLATRKAADLPDLGKKSLESQGARNMTTPVILNGPYGTSVVDDLTPDVNVLCIAGGTGVTFVLPVLLRLAHEPPFPCRKIDLVWSIRREQDVRWVAEELKEVRGSTPSHRTAVHIYVTRQQGDGIVSSLIPDGEESKSPAFMATVPSTPSVAPSNIELETESRLSIHHPAVADTLEKRRPHLQQIVEDFIDSVVRGPTIVFASGPVGMIADLRDAVASCNSGSRVWRGDSRFDVRLVCDDRLE